MKFYRYTPDIVDAYYWSGEEKDRGSFCEALYQHGVITEITYDDMPVGVLNVWTEMYSIWIHPNEWIVVVDDSIHTASNAMFAGTNGCLKSYTYIPVEATVNTQ